MLKASPAIALNQLLNICNQTLYQFKAPSDWRKALVVIIPKKGDPSICNNYRGISLLSVSYKVFCRILLIRMQERLQQEQPAYCKGRGSTEQIFTLEICSNKVLSGKHPCTAVSLILKRPDNFVNILQQLPDGGTCCIVENG